MNLISLSFTKVLVPKPGADQFFPNDHQKRPLPEKYPPTPGPSDYIKCAFCLLCQFSEFFRAINQAAQCDEQLLG